MGKHFTCWTWEGRLGAGLMEKFHLNPFQILRDSSALAAAVRVERPGP